MIDIPGALEVKRWGPDWVIGVVSDELDRDEVRRYRILGPGREPRCVVRSLRSSGFRGRPGAVTASLLRTSASSSSTPRPTLPPVPSPPAKPPTRPTRARLYEVAAPPASNASVAERPPGRGRRRLSAVHPPGGNMPTDRRTPFAAMFGVRIFTR